MLVEYSRDAICMVRAAMPADAPLRGEGLRFGPGDQDLCPRHGPHFVIRRGTNRCPAGRKHEVNCR